MSLQKRIKSGIGITVLISLGILYSYIPSIKPYFDHGLLKSYNNEIKIAKMEKPFNQVLERWIPETSKKYSRGIYRYLTYMFQFCGSFF